MRFKLLGDGDDWLGALHTVGSVADLPAWAGSATPPSPSPTPVGGQTCGGNCTVYSGGVHVGLAEGAVNLTAFRGAKASVGSAGLSFKFELLLTPCVQLNTTAHFGAQGRYWQFSCTNPQDPNCQGPTGMTAEKFLSAGVKVVNVHQGVPVLNPYARPSISLGPATFPIKRRMTGNRFINYPFEEVATEPLSALAQGMHEGGGKMKL